MTVTDLRFIFENYHKKIEFTTEHRYYLLKNN